MVFWGMCRTRLIPLFIVALSARSALAQWQVTGELGTSRLSQQGLGQSNATTFGVSTETGGERFALRSSALGAFMNSGRGTAQWVTTGIVATPTRNSWSLQTLGSVSAFGQSNLAPTSSADGIVQVRFGDGLRNIAVGGGSGVTSHNAVSIPELRGVADGMFGLDRERFSASASITRTRAVFGESSILVDNSLVYANYVDVGGGWKHTGASWSVGAAGGIRSADASSSDEWHSFEGELWVAPRVALTASVGRTLEDFVRGVPSATYATFALRLSSQPHLHLFAGGMSGPRLLASRGADQSRRIELLGVKASSVEFMADFTDWNPVALDRVGTTWRFDGLIPSGPHRIAIRIDGGEWIAPPNLPKVTDDLGGAMGLITIP